MSKGLARRSSSLPAKVLADRVVDVAAAQEVFADRQKLGDEIVGQAHAIKIHALGKLGELLRQLPKNVGAVPGKTGSKGRPVLDTTPTYADLGIDKKAAAVAQQLAALPPTNFSWAA